MLELRAVTKRYTGIPAVENVSFVARAGEVTGYLGPNGSGKSTTMKMITGLIEPSDGNAAGYAMLLAVLAAISAWAYRRNVSAPDAEILFDEVAPNDIEALNLRDRGPRGGQPLQPPPPEIPRAPFPLEQFFRDRGNAARMLTKSPGFSAAAIAPIAVAIGGNASIYSMVRAVLSKPAPGVTADGLVSFGATRNGRLLDPGEHSYPEYLDYATNTRTMRSITAIMFERFNLTLSDGSTCRLRGNLAHRSIR